MNRKKIINDKKWDQHTFAICAYGESPYLEECILSVLHQKLHTKILIATSTPNSHIQQLADQYHLPVFVNEGESGIAQDWSFAYEQAKTEYVTITHQDDVYFREYALEIYEAVKNRKKPLIIFTGYAELRNGKYVVRNKLLNIKKIMLLPLLSKSLQKSICVRRRILSFGSPISCPTVTYAKKQIPNPPFEVKLRVNLDWQTWEKLSKQEGEFIYCPHYLMAHRIHEESETSRAMRDGVRSKEDMEMFRKFWPKHIANIIAKLYYKSEDSNQLLKG